MTPSPERKRPHIAPFEVAIHNSPTDCWLSFLGKVFDVTEVIFEHRYEATIRPLVVFAGKDVSNWFDARTGEIQHFVHPVTGVLMPYCPHGRIPDVSYNIPTTLWQALHGPPWWRNEKYMVGLLTKRVVPLRILNMLSFKEAKLNVCIEDTFRRIQERYHSFNSESDSYTWMYKCNRKVDMEKTMEENGIIDERDRLAELGIPRSFYSPVVRLYYNDDLKHFDDLSDDEPEDEIFPCW